MPLQNFIARNLPTIKAAWLNGVDALKFTVFDDALTKAAARTALELNSQLVAQGTATGTANAVVVTLIGPVSNYVRATGAKVGFTATAANDSAATLNVNGTGVASIVNETGAALTGGELASPVVVEWTGTAWRLVTTEIILNNRRTALEVTTAITPANYNFGPRVAQRYSTFADLVTSLGSALTTLHGGRVQILSGVTTLTTTATINRKTCVIIGDNPGSAQVGDGTCIVWAGAAGIPMIEVKQVWGLNISNLRLKGLSTAKPSAALRFTSTTGDSPVNTAISIEDVWIGTYGLFDTDNATQFVDGIVVDGNNLQGDQSQIKHVTIQGCTTSCIAFRQTQNTLWSIETATLNSALYGIENKSRHITAKNIFCQTLSTADYYFPSDASMTVEGFGSELGGRLALAVDGYDLSLKRGYFQAATASVTASGRIIDMTSSGTGSITMENVQLYAQGGYAGPTLKFYARGTKVLIKLTNVSIPSAPDTFFDIATANVGDSRHVIFENVVDNSGVVYNCNLYWVHGAYSPSFNTEALGQQEKIVISGSKTYDIPNTADGGIDKTTVTVTGARLNDYAVAGFGTLASGWAIFARVISNDTVEVLFYNRTGGADNPGSALLTVMVTKF